MQESSYLEPRISRNRENKTLTTDGILPDRRDHRKRLATPRKINVVGSDIYKINELIASTGLRVKL